MNATAKAIQAALGVTADGIIGAKTLAAIAARLKCAATAKAIQAVLGVTADGIIGAKTLAALASRLGVDFSCIVTPTQAEVRSGKSIFGKAGDESNLVYVKPPYPIYYDGKLYTHGVRVHKLIADRLERVFSDVLAYYGAEKIHALKMDVYAGGYTYKKTAGGSSMSIHAWGLAIDWWPEQNAYSMHAPKAGFSKPEYAEWWRIWARHGFVSLGQARDFDWMHVQFATL